MIPIYPPVLLVAFVVTLLELTEVVVLVFALSADHQTVTHGALGAVAGVAVVGVAALVSGAALLALPRSYLLWASAVALAGFGVFLFRSTVKSYRRREAALRAGGPPAASKVALQFAGGFSVGAIETTEVVVVLLALTAAGYGGTAVLGAVAAGARSGRRDRSGPRTGPTDQGPAPQTRGDRDAVLVLALLGRRGRRRLLAGSDLILVGFFLAGVVIVERSRRTGPSTDRPGRQPTPARRR